MNDPQVLVLQHARSEGLGTIEDALRGSGHSFKYLRTFEGETIPKNAGNLSGLVIMGGPMGVYEHAKYPFLKDEMKLIESFLKEGKPILGVCLGSQLLASALGAEVKKGPRKEIGWYQIHLNANAWEDRLWKGQPRSFTAYHWHGDIFDLPTDAVPLASSDLTALQAFRHGENIYGLLFHMEVTREQIQTMLQEFSEEIAQEKLDGPGILASGASYLPPMQEIGKAFFGRWATLVDRQA
ncbi:MAG TPA: type 1 glutamine amidotransferase [Terriglobales bacterium]|jgi:GMP synthase (glutamine-hydrolysing)